MFTIHVDIASFMLRRRCFLLSPAIWTTHHAGAGHGDRVSGSGEVTDHREPGCNYFINYSAGECKLCRPEPPPPTKYYWFHWTTFTDSRGLFIILSFSGNS